MEVQGRILAVLPKRSGETEHGHWESQQYVLEYFADPRDRYAKRLLFTVFGADKIAQFDIKQGVEYNVSFDIDANESKRNAGQWFTEIRAWNVEPVNAGAAPASYTAEAL